MLISLAQQIPRALRRFLDLEAGVDDDDDNVGGRSEDDEFSPFNYSSNYFPWY